MELGNLGVIWKEGNKGGFFLGESSERRNYGEWMCWRINFIDLIGEINFFCIFFGKF